MKSKILHVRDAGVIGLVLDGSKTQIRCMETVCECVGEAFSLRPGFLKYDANDGCVAMDDDAQDGISASARYCGFTNFRVGDDVKIVANHVGEPVVRIAAECDSPCEGKSVDEVNFAIQSAGVVKVRITNMRVERLQDICIEDIYSMGFGFMQTRGGIRYAYLGNGSNKKHKTARAAYAVWAEDEFGQGVWERNPYVVAYKFERVV